MRILILGAGGIGGYLGARLLAAGRDVTFLVRPNRVEPLLTYGLKLVAPGEEITLTSLKVVTAETLAETYDLILLSCKAYDLQSSMEAIAPAVGVGSVILPMLNGMAHMDALDKLFGREHVLGGATTLSTHREPDGSIAHLNTLDDVQFGDRDNPASERIHRVAATLDVPGITIELSPDILKTMWHKWIAISCATSATCLMRANVGDIVAAGHASLVHNLFAETSSVAAAEGYPASDAYRNVVVTKFTVPGSLFTTSLMRDIESHARIEADHMIGDMIAHARRHGLQTPLLDITYAHLQCYEVRRVRELAAQS
jgi:2-dehydropantoate 2-reductase